jgi:hypothetical protein
MLLISGCKTGLSSESRTLSGSTSGFDVSPTNFIRQINLADRVTVTNKVTGTMPGYDGVGMSLSGDESKRLIQALSSLKSHFETNVFSDRAAVFFLWQLQFYKGTNLVATADFSKNLIECEGSQYYDSGGILEKIDSELSKQQKYNEFYKGEEEHFVAAEKVEARQWLKSPQHSVVPENKQKVTRFVDGFYAAGASKVFMSDIKKLANENGVPVENASMMIVILPQDTQTRSNVFSFVWKEPGAWATEPDSDAGQKYLWYPFQ